MAVKDENFQVNIFRSNEGEKHIDRHPSAQTCTYSGFGSAAPSSFAAPVHCSAFSSDTFVSFSCCLLKRHLVTDRINTYHSKTSPSMLHQIPVKLTISSLHVSES